MECGNRNLYPEGLSRDEWKFFETLDSIEDVKLLAPLMEDFLGWSEEDGKILPGALDEVIQKTSGTTDVFYFSTYSLSEQEKQMLREEIGNEPVIRERKDLLESGKDKEAEVYLIVTILGGGVIAYSDWCLEPFWQALLYRAKTVLQRQRKLTEYNEKTGEDTWITTGWKVIKKNGVFPLEE